MNGPRIRKAGPSSDVKSSTDEREEEVPAVLSSYRLCDYNVIRLTQSMRSTARLE